jgi:hypothetical protein
MWPESNDVNQAGVAPSPTLAQQPSNYLTPQQRNQMSQYANFLMINSGGTPSNSWGAGLANMAKAGIGGYLQGQVDQQTPHGPSILSGMFGTQPQSENPTQLASANGGQPNSIFSGLFGGAQPTT